MIFRSLLLCIIAVCAITITSISAQDQDFAAIQHKAQAGDSIAQYDLAKAYFEGKVVTKDPAEALAWLLKSADQGYFGAEYALAYMYLSGTEKLPKDQHKAAGWFRKAAKQQNKASQDKLATMQAQGLISAEEANWREAEPTLTKTQPQTVTHALPSPQKDVKGKPATFSLAEIETGITGGITSKRMSTLIQKFGVDFKLNSGVRKRLADMGADDSLLAAIAASWRSL